MTVKDFIKVYDEGAPVWLSYTNDDIISDYYNNILLIPAACQDEKIINITIDAQGEINLLIAEG